MNQEYLIRKYNNSGCNYDNRYYKTYRQAYADLRKGDVMLVCKPNSVYYGDNWQGWTVDPENIIRSVTKGGKGK